MTPDELKKRLREFALRRVRLAASFPRTPVGNVIGGQLIRAATGAAPNYRAACIARSHADLTSKMGIVEEEADESCFWIELAPDVGLVARRRVADLLNEGMEITKIVAKSRITAKSRK